MGQGNLNTNKMDHYNFYVGTYTNQDSRGIYEYQLKADGSLEKLGLVAESHNPSFLAKDSTGSMLLAVNEEKEGGVESYVIEEDTLRLVSRKSSGGAHPCFITINSRGYVLTANYGDGTVGLLRLSAAGELSGPLDVQQHTGQGTTDRQQGPHAHSVWIGEDERDVLSVDLGTNELWFSRIDTATNALEFSDPRTLNMSPDQGPRHMAFHASGKWAYVLNELSSTVTVLEKSAEGAYSRRASVSTLPSGFSEENTGADIHLSSDGRFLYASNRGHNSLVIYEVSPSDGSLRVVGHESTLGDGPRNFAMSPDGRYVVVANQKTSNIVSFERDQERGTLSPVGQIDAPTPVCILF